MGIDMFFTGIRSKKNIIPDEETVVPFGMFHSLIACTALVTFGNFEIMNGYTWCEVWNVRMMTIPYHDHFQLIHDGLPVDVLQTLTQNLRTLVRGDDDGEEGHGRGLGLGLGLGHALYSI